jgi:DNA-binding MarR family transcriptional regulator
MNDDVRSVQRSYPQIYLACHTHHVRAATSEHELSARDSSVLSHLDEERPVSPTELARHLGVTQGTMTECIDRLVDLGYVERRRATGDKRRVELLLSAKGDQAMQATSVLDKERVKRVLSRLAPAERKKAIEGLALLARAARELMGAEGKVT